MHISTHIYIPKEVSVDKLAFCKFVFASIGIYSRNIATYAHTIGRKEVLGG